VQFYNDRRIQLRRVVTQEEAKLLSGKIRFIDGVYVNILYMRRCTPGVCTEVDGGKLSVRFENGTGKYFDFQCDQKEYTNYLKIGPTKRPLIKEEKKLYSIVGDNWKHLKNKKYTGTVKYDNLDYTIRFRTHHWTRYKGEVPYMPSLMVRRGRSLYLHIFRRRIKGKLIQ